MEGSFLQASQVALPYAWTGIFRDLPRAIAEVMVIR